MVLSFSYITSDWLPILIDSLLFVHWINKRTFRLRKLSFIWYNKSMRYQNLEYSVYTLYMNRNLKNVYVHSKFLPWLTFHIKYLGIFHESTFIITTLFDIINDCWWRILIYILHHTFINFFTLLKLLILFNLF